MATHASETATASQQLPCQTDTDTDTTVALDPTYLTQALSAADTDEVVFRYSASHMTSHNDEATSNLGLIVDAGAFRTLLVPMRVD